jgi:adenosine deaminase
MDPLVMKSLLSKDKPTLEEIRVLPKVVLHEHLDGGLRPATIIDIAKEIGYTLPTYDLPELEKWFYQQCNSGSLVRYLQCFDITITMMQRKQDLIRIARVSYIFCLMIDSRPI